MNPPTEQEREMETWSHHGYRSLTDGQLLDLYVTSLSALAVHDSSYSNGEVFDQLQSRVLISRDMILSRMSPRLEHIAELKEMSGS
jgi:hypothetical protein